MKAYIYRHSNGDLRVAGNTKGLTSYVSIEVNPLALSRWLQAQDMYDASQRALGNLFDSTVEEGKNDKCMAT